MTTQSKTQGKGSDAKTRKTRRCRVAASVPRRYRAGLGPFGPAPVELELDAGQLAAIEADPYLTVTPLDG